MQLLQQRPLCVGALARRLQLTTGAVSQHLRLLREAGLVTLERRGYFIHYRLNQEALAHWQAAVQALLGSETSENRFPIATTEEEPCVKFSKVSKVVKNPAN
jgi:DNA-binding transcriptional ArsR family regulator